MKTEHFLSLAAISTALTLFISCGTMGDRDGNDKSNNSDNLSSNSGEDPSPLSCSSSLLILLSSSSNPPSSSSNSPTPQCRTSAGFILYNPSTHFCATDPDDMGNNKVYEKCNGNEYETINQRCSEGVLYTRFKDFRDDKMYISVKIGTQTWMAQNLSYKAPGSKCPAYLNENDPEDLEACETLGRQYDWATAMGISSSYNTSLYAVVNENHRGVCPIGWHIPRDEEWDALVTFIGSNPGTKLKANSGWNGNGSGTNNYGFTALPIGYYDNSGEYNYIGERGVWWAVTQSHANFAYNRAISNVSEGVSKMGNPDYNYTLLKTFMLSVRCIKD